MLVGWSQGAAVIGDILAQPVVPAASRILATVLYEDPAFTSGDRFDTGGYTPRVDGLFPRPARSLDRFASRLRPVATPMTASAKPGRSGWGTGPTPQTGMGQRRSS